MIPNGAPHARHRRAGDVLARFELTKRRYVLCVGRIDPGKRQLDLIDAFERARITGWKLAIVGGATPTDAYLARLTERASMNPDVVLTGYQEGPALRELYSHAGVFVLPSAAEGHPIALLEAASAIPANLFVPLPRDRFFAVGDIAALAKLLRRAAADPSAIKQGCQSVMAALRVGYSWRGAARRTRSVYTSVVTPVSNDG
jgi:glycosyltransferase involved in cell wall biosynthesis